MKRCIILLFIIVSCLGLGADTRNDNAGTIVDIPTKMETEILTRLNELNNSVENLQQQLAEIKPISEPNEDKSITNLLLGVCCLLGISNLVLLFSLQRKRVAPIQSSPETTHGKAIAKDTVGKADSILNAIQNLSVVLSRMEKNMSQAPLNNASYQQQTYQQQPYQPLNEKKTEQVGQEKEKVVNVRNIFYVQPDMDGGTIRLIDGGEDYKEMMPFVIQATGGEGLVRFNNANLNLALDNLETSIMPYSNCSIGTSGMARHIETVKEGRAQLHGNQWVLIEKPTLSVL